MNDSLFLLILVTENHSSRNGGRKHVIKQQYICKTNISLSNISGNVALASESAEINNHTQARGSEHSDVVHADTSQPPVNPTGTLLFEEDNEYDTVPKHNVTVVGERIHGSYCLHSHSDPLSVGREGEWKPGPSKGIVIKKGNLTRT